MPIYRHALDAVTLDDVLSLDLDSGFATLDLTWIAFVDAYALTGLACLVADTVAPKLVSSRDQARELTAGLPDDLSDTPVMVDCSALQASTPSFVDELVKAVLVDRGGSRLVIKGAPERTIELARRAAQNRGVTGRLEIG
jgi:hypothetical protein